MLVVEEGGEMAVPGRSEKEELRAEEPLGAAESEDSERVRTRGESVTTVPGTGVVAAEAEEEEEEVPVEVLETLVAEAVGLGEGVWVGLVDDNDEEVSRRGGMSAWATGAAETYSPHKPSPKSSSSSHIVGHVPAAMPILRLVCLCLRRHPRILRVTPCESDISLPVPDNPISHKVSCCV